MILYMLDTKFFKKQAKIYLLFSAFCCLFGIIYEIFSHNVYSYYMLLSFLIPLILGFLPSYIFYTLKFKNVANKHSITLYNCSILTFTLASIIKGILDIYGTTNKLIYVYLIAGLILIISSFFLILISKKQND